MPTQNPLAQIVTLLAAREEPPPYTSAEQDAWATTHQATLPEWKRQTAEALDTGVATARGVFGVGDESRAARGGEMINAIMPLGSLLRSPAIRGLRHLALQQQADQVSPVVGEAFGTFTQRYPRLSAHLSDVEPLTNASPSHAGNAIFMERPGFVPSIRMQVNPAHTEAGAAADTIRHEGAHMAKGLRLSDRARQRGMTLRAEAAQDPAKAGRLEEALNSPAMLHPVTHDYTTKHRAYGYFHNPHEVDARTAVELSHIGRDTPDRQTLARMRALDRAAQQMRLDYMLGNAKK